MIDRFRDEIDETLREEACRRAETIREFLKRRFGNATSGDVELRVSGAKLFRASGTVMSLVERKPGRPDGRRVLDEGREEIIRATINRYYLTKKPPRHLSVSSGYPNQLPIGGTEAARSPDDRNSSPGHEPSQTRQTTGASEIVKRTTAVPGGLTASRPLQIVQLDHTRADILVVDEETRQSLGSSQLHLI